ncbi:unnamed protein product [Trichobilharzia regenti]|nr:unnamed protein product [Trichobilharzia regenti]
MNNTGNGNIQANKILSDNQMSTTMMNDILNLTKSPYTFFNSTLSPSSSASSASTSTLSPFSTITTNNINSTDNILSNSATMFTPTAYSTASVNINNNPFSYYLNYLPSMFNFSNFFDLSANNETLNLVKKTTSSSDDTTLNNTSNTTITPLNISTTEKNISSNSSMIDMSSFHKEKQPRYESDECEKYNRQELLLNQSLMNKFQLYPTDLIQPMTTDVTRIGNNTAPNTTTTTTTNNNNGMTSSSVQTTKSPLSPCANINMNDAEIHSAWSKALAFAKLCMPDLFIGNVDGVTQDSRDFHQSTDYAHSLLYFNSLLKSWPWIMPTVNSASINYLQSCYMSNIDNGKSNNNDKNTNCSTNTDAANIYSTHQEVCFAGSKIASPLMLPMLSSMSCQTSSLSPETLNPYSSLLNLPQVTMTTPTNDELKQNLKKYSNSLISNEVELNQRKGDLFNQKEFYKMSLNNNSNNNNNGEMNDTHDIGDDSSNNNKDEYRSVMLKKMHYLWIEFVCKPLASLLTPTIKRQDTGE